MAYLWAALSVAALHTLLPVHWLPYVVMGKENGWGLPRLLRMVVGGTLVHLASTFALTAVTAFISFGLSHVAGHAMERAGALLLVGLSALYLAAPEWLDRWKARLGWFLAFGVGIQPCVELIPLMLAAATVGTMATVLVGTTWAVTTLCLTVMLVIAGFLGLPWQWTSRVQRFSRFIVGLLLLLSGSMTLLHTH
jgi:hypothetical protein